MYASKIFTTLVGSVFALLIASALANSADIYIGPHGRDTNRGDKRSPFATVAQAQLAIRTRIAAGASQNFVVQIAGGVYPQAETLKFGPEDSAAGSTVTYAAAPGQKVLLTGGRPITGWKPYDDHLWMTTIPDVKLGRWYFNQLFVDGRRATRARTPNYDVPKPSWKITSVKAVGEGANSSIVLGLDHPIGPWKNPSDIEVVWLYNNDCSRKTISSIDTTDQTVTLGPPLLQLPPSLPQSYLIGRPAKGQTCFLENAFEFLDSPGEWYLDRTSGTLYYYPLPGETMATSNFVAAVVQNCLLDIEGTPAKPVRNLHFQGISVEHVDYPLPDDGYVGLFGCIQPAVQQLPTPALTFSWIPAAVTFRFATDCSFSDGSVAHCGGIGVGMLSGCSRITVKGNRIYDLGGGGVVAGAIRNRDFLQAAEPVAVTDQAGYQIVDNYVHDCGVNFAGAAGIFTAVIQQSLVAHNEICNIAYSGICVGGNTDRKLAFPLDNVYMYNNIHNVMQTAVDGAGIYVGCTYPAPSGPTGILRGNWIHDLAANPENTRGIGPWTCPGIYLDGVSPNIGIKGYEITDNVVYHTSNPPLFLLHCSAADQKWTNNILQNDAPERSVLDEITATAGLEPAYRHLLAE